MEKGNIRRQDDHTHQNKKNALQDGQKQTDNAEGKEKPTDNESHDFFYHVLITH